LTVNDITVIYMTVISLNEGKTMAATEQLPLRLPPDLKAWLRAEAEKNASSQNSEVIRAIRAAMASTAPQPTT